MTTATTTTPRYTGFGVLARAAVGATFCGLVVVAVAAIAADGPAVRGALLGVLLAVGVSTWGSFGVNLVAGAIPKLALAYAMLTYLFQVIVLGAAFVAVRSSGLLESDLAGGWVAAGVIASVSGWVVTHVRAATTARVPVYEFAPQTSEKVASEPSEEPTDAGVAHGAGGWQ